MAKVKSTQAQKFLGSMDHPAGKNKIVKRAEQNGADENAIDVLGRIPDRQCDGPNVVSPTRSAGSSSRAPE